MLKSTTLPSPSGKRVRLLGVPHVALFFFLASLLYNIVYHIFHTACIAWCVLHATLVSSFNGMSCRLIHATNLLTDVGIFKCRAASATHLASMTCRSACTRCHTNYRTCCANLYIIIDVATISWRRIAELLRPIVEIIAISKTCQRLSSTCRWHLCDIEDMSENFFDMLLKF